MAAPRPAVPPAGLRAPAAVLLAAAQRLPLDLQARARRNAWSGVAEVRAAGRARREADEALAALASATIPAAPAAPAAPRRAAR